MPMPSPQDLHDLLHEFAGLHPTRVALGLVSFEATPHVVLLDNGTRLFTWCALDTLILGHLLDCDLEATSRPPFPAVSEPVAYRLRGGTLQAPDGVVLSFPSVRNASGEPFTSAFCPFANLFRTVPHYRRWAQRQPRDTTPLSLHHANRIALEYATQASAGHATPADACAS